MTDIVVDSNEYSLCDIGRNLEKFGLEIKVTKLPIGDYLLLTGRDDRKPILIERKTVTDFIGSIKGRLWNQLKYLSNAKEKVDVLLLIEGWWGIIDKLDIKFNRTAVWRIMDTIILRFNIPIIQLPNKFETIKWMAQLSKSLNGEKKKTYYPLRVDKAPKDIEARIIYVVEGLNGIVTAYKLLKKFGSIENLVKASKEEIMRINGIGGKTANKIYEILHREIKL